MSVASLHRPLRLPRPALAVLLAVAVGTAGGSARADEYDAAFTRAIAAKERALDSNDPASWDQALELFLRADRIRSTKESKYELGSAAARLKQDDLAVEAYQAALELGLDGTARDKARELLDAKSGEMARLAIRGPAGTEVVISGRSRGTLPLARPLVVFAGRVEVHLRTGSGDVVRRLELGPDTEGRLDADDPGATSGGGTSVGGAGGAGTADQPAPASSLPSTLLWGGGALALVGVGTLVVAYSSLGSHRDELGSLCAVQQGDACPEAEPGQRQAAQDEVDAIATWKAVRAGGFVGLGVGLVAVGAGAVMLLGRTGRAKPSASWHPAAVATPGGAALGVVGEF